jgi:oxygen-independent coproporphyrinogen-3 oxidase
LAERQGHGLITQDLLTPEAQGDEFLLTGLRLGEGVDPARYEVLSGRSLDERRIADLLGDGLITRRVGARLAVTSAGFPVLDSVVADLAA